MTLEGNTAKGRMSKKKENEERVMRCSFVKLAHVCVGITNWLGFVGITKLFGFVQVFPATPLFGPCGRKGKHLSCEEVCLRRGAAIVYRHFPFVCATPYSGNAVRSNGCGTLQAQSCPCRSCPFCIVPPRLSPASFCRLPRSFVSCLRALSQPRQNDLSSHTALALPYCFWLIRCNRDNSCERSVYAASHKSFQSDCSYI